MKKIQGVLRLLAGILALVVASPARGAVAQEGASPAETEQPCDPELWATAQHHEPDRPPHFLRQLGGDFRNLVRGETLTILAIGGAASALALPIDAELTREAVASEGLDRFFESGDVVGGGLVQLGGALTSYTMGRLTKNSRLEAVGRDLIRAQIVSQVLTQGVKLAVDRTRPDGAGFSFPSGHTSSSFASATVLTQHFGWKVGVPAFAVASWVAGSRLQENRHFLSDVLFGASLGVVAGRTVTLHHGRTRLTIAPMWMPRVRGAAVTLAWGGGSS